MFGFTSSPVLIQLKIQFSSEFRSKEKDIVLFLPAGNLLDHISRSRVLGYHGVRQFAIFYSLFSFAKLNICEKQEIAISYIEKLAPVSLTIHLFFNK